jgi:hypothetical protein
MAFGGADLVVKTGLANGNSATVVETFNGAGSIGSYNGATVTGGSGTNSMDGLAIGGAGSVYGSDMFGDIIIFPSALSAPNRITLETNQKVYYGTP